MSRRSVSDWQNFLFSTNGNIGHTRQPVTYYKLCCLLWNCDILRWQSSHFWHWFISIEIQRKMGYRDLKTVKEFIIRKSYQDDELSVDEEKFLDALNRQVIHSLIEFACWPRWMDLLKWQEAALKSIQQFIPCPKSSATFRLSESLSTNFNFHFIQLGDCR